MDISPEHQAVLLETIRAKMASNPLKIRVDFALTCTSFEGVEVIKEALLTAKHQVNDETWNLDFKMIAPPNYKCEVQTHSRAEGEQKLKEALVIIRDVMKKKGGHFKQKSEPTVIGQKSDEPEVAEMLEGLKARGGDDDEEDSEPEEDNDEGMGDIDLDDVVPDAISDDEECKE